MHPGSARDGSTKLLRNEASSPAFARCRLKGDDLESRRHSAQAIIMSHFKFVLYTDPS
jgi:hypothetical protein